MSVNSSHYRFPNCSCEEHLACEFHEACTCGNKSCGHSIELHSDISNDNNNNGFSSPSPEQLPQFTITMNELTSESTL